MTTAATEADVEQVADLLHGKAEHVWADYAPLSNDIETASLDLVTCYIGLHHMHMEQLPPFLAPVHRVLRPGGLLPAA